MGSLIDAPQTKIVFHEGQIISPLLCQTFSFLHMNALKHIPAVVTPRSGTFPTENSPWKLCKLFFLNPRKTSWDSYSFPRISGWRAVQLLATILAGNPEGLEWIWILWLMVSCWQHALGSTDWANPWDLKPSQAVTSKFKQNGHEIMKKSSSMCQHMGRQQ